MTKKSGDILKEYRNKQKISIRKLGETLGISPSFISEMENDKKPFPNTELGEKIIEFLKIKSEDVDRIRFYTENKKRQLDRKIVYEETGWYYEGPDGKQLTPVMPYPYDYFEVNELKVYMDYEENEKYDNSLINRDYDDNYYLRSFVGEFPKKSFAIVVQKDDSMYPLINDKDIAIVNPNENIDEDGIPVDSDRTEECEQSENSTSLCVTPVEERVRKKAEIDLEYKRKRKYYFVSYYGKTFIREILFPNSDFIVLRCSNYHYEDTYIKIEDLKDQKYLKIHGRVINVLSEKKL